MTAQAGVLIVVGLLQIFYIACLTTLPDDSSVTAFLGNIISFIGLEDIMIFGSMMWLLMIVFGFGLLSRRRVVHNLTCIVLTSCAIILTVSFGSGFEWWLLAIVGWLVVSRPIYDVKTAPLKTRGRIAAVLGLLLLPFVYSCVCTLIEYRIMSINHFSAADVLLDAFWEIFDFMLTDVPGYHIIITLLNGSITFVTVVCFGLLAILLTRPAIIKIEQEGARRRVPAILEKHSVSSEDYFHVWPTDKQYYFAKNNDSFISYKIQNATSIVLMGPVGLAQSKYRLMQNFVRDMRQHSFYTIIINGSEELGRHLDSRFSQYFIGKEAVVDIAQFTQKTFRSKRFRYVKNKAMKENLRVEYWGRPSSYQINQLKVVSDEWLASGRREYTFFMGYFDRHYLAASKIFVLYVGNRLAGYVSAIPTYDERLASIDHMRIVGDVPRRNVLFIYAYDIYVA